MRAASTFAVVSLVTLGACGPASDDGAATEAALVQAHTDSVMLADSMYSEASFDTISWETEEDAVERGLLVYNISCQKCHGPAGAGDGGFVVRGDTLRPPSFLTEDWRFAEDHDGLRRLVFTGTAQGMPHWGFYGLRLRDIDAVATYIQRGLRQ